MAKITGKFKKAEIEKVISRGGDVVSDKKQDSKEWVVLSLRIKTSMIQDIEKALEDTVGISRTGWILQAIQEKLKRTNA